MDEKLKQKIYTMMGAPMRAVELDDEMMEVLFQIACDDFLLYSTKAQFPLEMLNIIKQPWIDSYFIMLCMKTLSRVWGKYGGKIGVDDAERTLDFRNLSRDADIEKERLLDYFK